MEASIWTGTLSGFREKAGGMDPVPAGVAISAVTASLALALLAKVLAIAGKRKSFTGDRQRLTVLLDTARAESTRLTQFADEDIQAFHEYLESGHEGARKAIEVPMDAARSVVRGLGLCAEAAGMVQGLTAADIGAAAALLSGAVRAMLLSVDFNIREMSPDQPFSESVSTERRNLEIEAARHADAVAAAAIALLR